MTTDISWIANDELPRQNDIMIIINVAPSVAHGATGEVMMSIRKCWPISPIHLSRILEVVSCRYACRVRLILLDSMLRWEIISYCTCWYGQFTVRSKPTGLASWRVRNKSNFGPPSVARLSEQGWNDHVLQGCAADLHGAPLIRLISPVQTVNLPLSERNSRISTPDLQQEMHGNAVQATTAKEEYIPHNRVGLLEDSIFRIL